MKIAPLLALLFTVFQLEAAEYDLGSHGILSLETGDKIAVIHRSGNNANGIPMGHEFALSSTSGVDAKCKITFYYAPTNGFEPERIRQQLLEGSERFVVRSVEQKKNLKEFSIKQGYGAYCAFTDSTLAGKPVQKDNFKAVAVGVLQLDNKLAGSVVIAVDDLNSKEFKAMVTAINSLKLKPKSKP